MATMSYCAIENTADNMDTVFSTMQNFDEEQEWYDSLSDSEKDALPHLIDRCQLFLETVDHVEMD